MTFKKKKKGLFIHIYLQHSPLTMQKRRQWIKIADIFNAKSDMLVKITQCKLFIDSLYELQLIANGW